VTNIKKFCVGSPIQAAADAMTDLVQEHRLTRKGEEDRRHLPPMGSQVVNNRAMPDINCQYLVAVILLDGKLTFEAAHSYERMADPRVRAVQARVNLIGDSKFAELERKRPGQVRVQMEDGRVFEKLVPAVRGTRTPMSGRRWR